MLKKSYYWLKDFFAEKEERGEFSAGYWQGKVREIVFSFSRDSQGRLLEVGCGEGLFLKKFIADRRVKIFGLDLSFSILKNAQLRTENKAGLLLADAVKLPFKDGVFDTVACINVFLNMPNEELVDKSLEEIKRVSKNGARLYFDLRNKLNPIIFLKYKLVRFYDSTVDEKRLRLYRFKSFKGKLTKLGFRVTKIKSIGFPPGAGAPVLVIEAVLA